MSLPRRALAGLALLLVGCAPDTAAGPVPPAAAVPDTPAAPAPVPPTLLPPEAVRAARPAPPELPRQLPGVGPDLLAAIPAGTRQALVVTGDGPDASAGRAVLYRNDGTGWLAGPSWPTRNARDGWTPDHREGDLRSPIGVFTLGDAGGRLPDPGTRLRYDRSDAFSISGTGFAGEPLAGAFDYVVAIDYNRVPGSSPLDRRRPRGGGYGGGIWLHVDHGGPTHGCIGLSPDRMRELLLALDPALHPVVVMGDARALAR
ncbi:L,D-transpeptidase family protein [Kitasatospora sp. NPDC057542]|uniref:L,D-transpeptidase family protein n=1 Tax=Streptomycetaceae TaxID=2062 RepID=UPI001CCF3468|nr:L,D-transpeptidase family protein [Streptomyces sp. LS1784]